MPLEQDTANLLSLMAEDPRKDAEYDEFLRACWTVAQRNAGLVFTNDVRALLSDQHGELTIFPRQFSAYFCRATGKGGPLVKTERWATCTDPKKKNSGRPQPVRRWVGEPLQHSSASVVPPALAATKAPHASPLADSAHPRAESAPSVLPCDYTKGTPGRVAPSGQAGDSGRFASGHLDLSPEPPSG